MYINFYQQLINGPLDAESSYKLADFLLSDATDIEIASLLTLLNTHPYTADILFGFSQALKSKSKTIPYSSNKVMDVCGTGGDGHNTFNISTTTALILKEFIPIAKHGNSSITSKSGSADVLKELNITISEDETIIATELLNNNFSFLFAPYMHPEMKYIMQIRKQLKVPTIFNVIGPLCNPINLTHQVVGVYNQELLLPMAKVLLRQGLVKAAIVCGHNNMDELTTTGINHIALIDQGKIDMIVLDPSKYGFKRSSLDVLKGGSAVENAVITNQILNGEQGQKTDIVILNAAFALYIGEVVESIENGIQLVTDYLYSSSQKEIL